MRKKASNLFRSFFESEKSSGIVLIFFTLISLLLTNSSFQENYLGFWELDFLHMPLEHWVNDVLMAIFFLLIGLELKREFQVGELSNLKTALLPVVAALGGMLIPALIYFLFNFGTPTLSGYGIPMATDIAFALGVLSLLGNKVPLSMKVFLTALAVIDDLGAILVIAIFYTATITWLNLLISLGIFALLLVLNKLKIKNLLVYLVGGVFMWYFMHHSGIHATITGVLLAFTIPTNKDEEKSPAGKLQHWLHFPVPFVILPIFAMANTAVVLHDNIGGAVVEPYGLGILFGLSIGKPIGIALFAFIAIKLGWCKMPAQTNWSKLFGLGLLGGIGFTMSIFVTLLAFNQKEIIDNAKIVILISSLVSGFLGYVWLRLSLDRKKAKQ